MQFRRPGMCWPLVSFALFPLSALGADTPCPAGPQAMLLWTCGSEELRQWPEVKTVAPQIADT